MLTVKDMKDPAEPILSYINSRLWEKEAIPVLNKIYEAIPKEYTDQFVSEEVKITTSQAFSELRLPLANGNLIGISLMYSPFAKWVDGDKIKIDVKVIRKWINEAICLNIMTIKNGKTDYDECYLNPDEGLWNYILDTIIEDPTFFK